MQYDFIEIGTSFFNTEIENATDKTIGLSIEPVKDYLDKLPIKQNVKKNNAAISFNNTTYKDYIFYIPTETIKEHDLEFWFNGCNSIGNYHPLHIQHNVQHLVKKLEIPVISIEALFAKNDVTDINFFKIDTEGTDSYILESLFTFTSILPKKIKFEANETSNIEHVKYIIDLASDKGYITTQYSTKLSQYLDIKNDNNLYLDDVILELKEK